MNKIKIYYKFFLFLTLFSTPLLISQEIDENNMEFDYLPNTKREILNTCAYYKFFPKDTLIYAVDSKDSIVISFGVPLLKMRNEQFMVICDSIGKENKHFYLQLQYVKFQAKEWTNEFNEVNHNENDWLNRKIYLEIDSVGKRYSIGNEDTNKVGLSSGGAFQPYLFFNFEKACSDTGMPWVIKDEYDNLIENGIPMPVLHNSIIIKNKGPIDTLGFKSNRLSITKTGQGSIYIQQKKKKIRFTNIMAVGGDLLIGTETKVPIYYHQEQDQKIHIKSGKTFKEKGNFHYTNTYFRLIKYNRINYDISDSYMKFNNRNNNKKK